MRQGLLLGDGPASVVLRNHTTHPLTPTIEHVAAAGAGIPLSLIVRAVGKTSGELTSLAAPRPAGAWTLSLPALEAGQSLQVPMEARLEEMNARAVASVLRIRTDLGTESWVPVFAIRKDLAAP